MRTNLIDGPPSTNLIPSSLNNLNTPVFATSTSTTVGSIGPGGLQTFTTSQPGMGMHSMINPPMPLNTNLGMGAPMGGMNMGGGMSSGGMSMNNNMSGGMAGMGNLPNMNGMNGMPTSMGMNGMPMNSMPMNGMPMNGMPMNGMPMSGGMNMPMGMNNMNMGMNTNYNPNMRPPNQYGY